MRILCVMFVGIAVHFYLMISAADIKCIEI
jgi:hypothetical protein